MPHPDWVLQVGIEYDVTVHIYSHDGRKVFITDVRMILFLKENTLIYLKSSYYFSPHDFKLFYFSSCHDPKT